MTVAQAQNKVWELAKLLMDQYIQVKFAIHPIAGCILGHMNVLAEAGVCPMITSSPWMKLMKNLPRRMWLWSLAPTTSLIPLPVNRLTANSTAYPYFTSNRPKTVIVIKRGEGRGFSGVENGLFYMDHI